MAKSGVSIARKDEELLDLVGSIDQQALAAWAIECAERGGYCREDVEPAGLVVTLHSPDEHEYLVRIR